MALVLPARLEAVCTGMVSFRLRPALSPRDRSLIAVAALIANGQTAQIAYHLNRALENDLTQAQASELLTQLAFYAGWPCAFSALPVVREVLEKRQK